MVRAHAYPVLAALSSLSLVAIALVGLGGGMGLQAIRHLRGRSSPPGDAP